VAASNQRTPAGRRLPVTLAAGSAADSSRPDTRPHPKADTRAPPRWTAAAAAGLPGPAVAVPARCGRPCAPRLLGCGGQSGQAGAAGGHRRSGHADSGRGLWTPIARDRTAIWTPATAAGVIGHCCSGPAGQPAAEPSTTMTPAGRRWPPQARPSDAERPSPPLGTVLGLIKLASSLPWIGRSAPCYPAFSQVARHRKCRSYVLTPGGGAAASSPGGRWGSRGSHRSCCGWDTPTGTSPERLAGRSRRCWRTSHSAAAVSNRPEAVYGIARHGLHQGEASA
jgi:hypothetical protein